jgi:hypothetical protein
MLSNLKIGLKHLKVTNIKVFRIEINQVRHQRINEKHQSIKMIWVI